MLNRTLWFILGYAVAKITEGKDSVKKIRRIARKCADAVKEEFGRKQTEEVC